METEKPKKTGRPRKPDAKRHVFAFRFDDVQMSVIDWMFTQYAQPKETKSEIVARLFTSFLAANLAEKALAEKARVQGVPLTLQYREENRQTVNRELNNELRRQANAARSGEIRRFVPSSVPLPADPDEGIPLPADAITQALKGADNSLPEIEGIEITL
ncbi:hypothetical protein J6Y50_06705 [bacterium]|nr:hypothetical protein [bacterium]